MLREKFILLKFLCVVFLELHLVPFVMQDVVVSKFFAREVERVAIILFLEEESILVPQSFARGSDKLLCEVVFHIYKRKVFETRANYEWEFDNIEAWMTQQEVLMDVIFRAIV